MDNYTAAEKDKLLEFSQLVSDILTEDQKDDSFLIRWLRARNLDVKKAEEMLRNDVEWRKQNKVDGILDREEAPEDLRLNAPIAWCGTTSEGYPLLLAPMGRHDGRRFVEKYGKEAVTRFNIIFMEKLSRQLEIESKRQGRKVTQIVEIIDFEGYSYRQISSKLCRELMVESQKIFDCHYPELLRYAVVINAPKFFAVFFAMMKPFIPKQTLEKIDIYGPDKDKWRKVIAEKFPVENIPPHWGGTLEGKDEFCSGSDIWIQGPSDLRPFMNGLADSDAEYSVVTVNARDKVTKELDVSERDSVVEWKFKTESHDIGFQVKFFAAETKDESAKDVFPYTRVDAHNSVQEGSYICECPGKVQFIFDNNFSIVKSKTLLYKISVDSPVSEFEECPEF